MRGLPEGGVVAGQDTIEALARVFGQMEMIRHLQRVGRTLPRPISVRARAVAADDLNARVGA